MKNGNEIIKKVEEYNSLLIKQKWANQRKILICPFLIFIVINLVFVGILVHNMIKI